MNKTENECGMENNKSDAKRDSAVIQVILYAHIYRTYVN